MIEFLELTGNSGARQIVMNIVWETNLTAAVHQGWKPKGTLKPAHMSAGEVWNGSYTTKERQIVEEDDARELGTALERALADPDPLRFGTLLKLSGKECKSTHFAFEHIRELADFCKRGGFTISRSE